MAHVSKVLPSQSVRNRRTPIDLVLPLLIISALLTLGWFVALRFRQTMRDTVIGAYQETQLEIVRAVARSAVRFVQDEVNKGRDFTEIEQAILKDYVDPVQLLDSGDAWIYAPDHVVFDMSADFPAEYVGKSMAQIFALQVEMGASHYEEMTAAVSVAQEGTGWYIWLPEKGIEIGAWTPVKVGNNVWTIGLSTPLSEILTYSGAAEQETILLGTMAVATVAGVIIGLLLTRSQMQRRRAEMLLADINLNLERRVSERTNELAARTQEVLELQYRERLMEKDAEVAYNAGLFESASSYIHNVGNSLTALEGRVLNLRRVSEASAEYPAALQAIREAHTVALAAPASDQTPALLDRLDQVLVNTATPLLNTNLKDIINIKDQMIAAIRHQQEMFATDRNRSSKYHQEVNLAQLVLAVLHNYEPSLQRRGIHVATQLDNTISIMTQKHPLWHGIANLINNAIDAIDTSTQCDCGVISITLTAVGKRAELRVRDNGLGVLPEVLPRLFMAGFTTKAKGHGLGLHSFATFLNENNGAIRVTSNGSQQGSEFIVEIGHV
jgi:signal transduction histidine kinase